MLNSVNAVEFRRDLGLPLDQVLYSPSMRPFNMAAKGKPMVDLFG